MITTDSTFIVDALVVDVFNYIDAVLLNPTEENPSFTGQILVNAKMETARGILESVIYENADVLFGKLVPNVTFNQNGDLRLADFLLPVELDSINTYLLEMMVEVSKRND